MFTIGENISEIEKYSREYVGCQHMVAILSGTTVFHLAIRLAGNKCGY